MPELALRWLREILSIEFAAAFPRRARQDGEYDAARDAAEWSEGAVEPQAASWDPTRSLPRDTGSARWQREWSERWRRLRAPLQFSRFVEMLAGADSEDAVFRAVAESAVGMVGGYTCLVFPPRPALPLRPLPNAVLRIHVDRLTFAHPPAEAGTLHREEVLARGGGALASLAPLFNEERVVSIAYAPFGTGGVILLVERREKRIFDAVDKELLCLLASHGAAALARVRASTPKGRERVGEGVLAGAEAAVVLDHAIAMAERGEPLAVARLRLHGLEQVVAEDGERAAERIRRTAAEVLREMAGALGIPLHHDDAEFLLVLPRRGTTHLDRIVGSLQRQLPQRVRVRAGLTAYRAGDHPSQLLARTLQTLGEPGLSGAHTRSP